MWSVSNEKFEYGLQQFTESILDKQDAVDYRTTAIAFHAGYLYDREWYKRLVWTKAHNGMNPSVWKEEMIGSGRIMEEVSMVLNRKTDGRRNSIINWRSVAGLRSQFREKKEDSERVLYMIFHEKDDRVAFEEAVKVWGATYPAISYLFFLKNRHIYMPVRPQLFRDRLEHLGFTTACMEECNWDNYLEFLEILKWIQKQLIRKLDDSTELIDAHTFLILVDPEEQLTPSEDSREILEMDRFDTVVVTGPRDNRKKEYYLSRYEKEPACHEAAVSVHGYQCMACGFDFEKTYGALGRNFIEVHHFRPLHSPDEEVEINPAEDLVCLCSNCHRMIHRDKNAVMSLEELKQWLIWGPILE